MKQKDYALILVIVFASGILSFVIANFTFGSASNREQKAQIVDKINADFPSLDKRYFNDSSVDPTHIIQIDDNNNQNPFGSQQPSQ